MKRERLPILKLILTGLAVAGLSAAGTGSAKDQARAGQEQTALDEYVHAPDTNYSFHLVSSAPSKDYTAFVLEMTSQAWLTTNEVNRTLCEQDRRPKRRCIDRLYLGQIPSHRRCKVARPPANDQGRCARDGYGNHLLRQPRRRQGKGGRFCRGRRFQARLDNLDDRGGGQACGGDRAHCNRCAEC